MTKYRVKRYAAATKSGLVGSIYTYSLGSAKYHAKRDGLILVSNKYKSGERLKRVGEI